MNPGEKPPEEWQQPAENLSQAPYQAPAEPVEAPQTAPESVPAPDIETPAASEASVTDASAPDTASASPREQAPADDGDGALLHWQATEHIDYQQGLLWYGILALVVVVLALLAIFIFHSWTFAILIPVMLVALVVYVRRPPALLDYTLSHKGLHVNDKLFAYDQFKAFGVTSHEGVHSVLLLPRKRFQVSQTVYFPEEVGESLVDMLAARLPMQEVKLDAIDRLLKKLRI